MQLYSMLQQVCIVYWTGFNTHKNVYPFGNQLDDDSYNKMFIMIDCHVPLNPNKVDFFCDESPLFNLIVEEKGSLNPAKTSPT